MRNTFIKVLIEEAEKNKEIFLLTGDLGYSVLEPFAERFPDRFLNVGIAEQNMLGIASGLSKEGFKVFVYSIGNFPTLRAMEQIRYDICYHNANVTIVAVGGGFAYGPLGTSHHTTEEIGMLRTIPNIFVSAPGDPIEVEAVTRFFCNNSGPSYLRLNKTGEKNAHTDKILFEEPRGLEIQKTGKKALLVNGSVLQDVYADSRIGNEYSLFSFPFVKPIDVSLLIEIAKNYEEIITMEEHQKSCGFGSAVIEVLSDAYSKGQLKGFPKVKRIAIDDEFISTAGTQEFLKKKSGLILN